MINKPITDMSLIQHKDINVNVTDRFDGITLIGCNIFCEFDISLDQESATQGPFVRVGELKDFYTADFIAVFNGATLSGCILKDKNYTLAQEMMGASHE